MLIELEAVDRKLKTGTRYMEVCVYQMTVAVIGKWKLPTYIITLDFFLLRHVILGP